MTHAPESWLRSHLVELRRRHRLPGVAAAIVGSNGRVEIDSVGVTKRDGDTPVKRDDSWHIGSCGKSMTAALYARLVERGDAAWGVGLHSLFPDLAGSMHPDWADVAVEDVLLHRAGLRNNVGRTEMIAAYSDTRPLRDQRTEATAAALSVAPRRRGSFRYSNLGYIIVGAAIERITDSPFESALDTHVLQALGMTSCGFGPPPQVWGNGGRAMLARFGLVVGRGAPGDPLQSESDNPPIMSPAGRLHLTLEDWAKFQRVFLAPGTDFLRPRTVERLLTPAVTGAGTEWALGWANAGSLGGASFGQQGSNTYWVATALIDRTREHTAMVVCNDGRTMMLKHTARFAAHLLDERRSREGEDEHVDGRRVDELELLGALRAIPGRTRLRRERSGT